MWHDDTLSQRNKGIKKSGRRRGEPNLKKRVDNVVGYS